MKAENIDEENSEYFDLQDYATKNELPQEVASKKRTNSTLSSLSLGAKTAAGVGLGLIGVIGGAAILAIGVETILVPSLLLKLAGGMAGGGLGLAKGIKDDKRKQ